MWSNLAHEMTAEFRGLCAEEVSGDAHPLHLEDLLLNIFLYSHRGYRSLLHLAFGTYVG